MYTSDYNPFAITLEEMTGSARPKPYTVVAVRHGGGVAFQTTIYDVDGASACARVGEALMGRKLADDPTAEAWWRSVDACAVYAGRITKEDHLLQVWWRAATPQCQRSLDRLGLRKTPQAMPRS